MGRGSECTPGVSDEAIALEGTERHIASRQRISNEIGVQVELGIDRSPQEVLKLHDAKSDTPQRAWRGGASDQGSNIYSIDAEPGVPLELRHDPDEQAPRPAPTSDIRPEAIQLHSGDHSTQGVTSTAPTRTWAPREALRPGPRTTRACAPAARPPAA